MVTVSGFTWSTCCPHVLFSISIAQDAQQAREEATRSLAEKSGVRKLGATSGVMDHRENGGKTPWDGTLNNQPYIITPYIVGIG